MSYLECASMWADYLAITHNMQNAQIVGLFKDEEMNAPKTSEHSKPIPMQRIRINMIKGDKKTPVIIELPASMNVSDIMTADWEEISSNSFKT